MRCWSAGRTATLAGSSVAVAAVSVAVTVAVAFGAGPRGSALSGPVRITRDRAGIPHIVASNFTALGYGEGYAFAQDNLCTFANDVVTVEGERSRYFGPKGLAVNYSAGSYVTNLQSDLYWRYIQATGLVQRELAASSPPNGLLPQARQLYSGWVAGYNAYLRSRKLRAPTCKGRPWVRPIRLTDMLLRGVQIVTEASSEQFVGDIVNTVPPNANATAAGARTASPAHAVHGFGVLERQLGDQSDSGSNGIGVGAQDTRSGHGLVLANPHFPWRGTERFWMAQLDVPGQYDVEGGTLMGFPLIGIGFNRDIAWTHTVSTDRRFVAYQLKLVPGDPTSYYLNGRAVKMGHVRVSVSYAGKTVRHTFYTTHWGLVVSVAAVPLNAYVWNDSTAYALYDAEIDNGPRAVDEYLRMGQATSVKDLYNVEAKWLAIPTFNTIAADDHGDAYYGDVGATPAVSQSELNACLPSGIPTLVYNQARIITLDGSRTACAPANFPGTPEKGIFSSRYLPHIFRRDYVENSNNSFWLANPLAPLTGFSSIIGRTGTEQSLRTRLGNQMIAERVNGTDGLGPPKFTISTLQQMWEGDRSGLAALVLTDLVADCRAHPEQAASNGQIVDLTAACNALAGYDGTGTLNANGGWLFVVWSDLDSDSPFYATPFNPAQPLTTPSGLNTSSTATPLRWLADAVQNLQAHGVPVDASIGQVQYAPQSRRIPIPGCPGDASSSGPATGCFNAISSNNDTAATSGPLAAAPYGQVLDGSSLVMTTQLNPSGPASEGILTYSESTDPTSPWYANMTKLYSKGQWVKLPYTAAELATDHPHPPNVLTAP
jgi:acyl-homoserine-lactone acylase